MQETLQPNKTLVATNWFARLAIIAFVFALLVVVFGAFVRLSNAGLSCPDWPTCYGKLTWPKHAEDIANANVAYPERLVETSKAWREQVHRFLAGGLVLITFALATMAWQRRTYSRAGFSAAMILPSLILFQAVLGMWTVTWKLMPAVVMGHLLGGMATLSLLAWVALRSNGVQLRQFEILSMKRALIIVGIGLLAIQIALGGWTSSNYAALSCGLSWPKCGDLWWPAKQFSDAFVFFRSIGVDYEGGILDGEARATIHLVHRWFAWLVFGHLMVVVLKSIRSEALKKYGYIIAILLILQIALGIGNVKMGLPLWMAAAHNGVAALLLCSLIALLARVSPADKLPG